MLRANLMDQPLNVLCELGGWKAAQTVLQFYQPIDEDYMPPISPDSTYGQRPGVQGRGLPTICHGRRCPAAPRPVPWR